MFKKIMSLSIAGLLVVSMVGCSSTVEEPVSNIVSLQSVDTQVVKKESVVNITNIELKQDNYDRDYLEVTYDFTNNDFMTTNADLVINMSAYQNAIICFYPQVDKYTQYEEQNIEVGATITDCKFYVLVDKDKEVLLKVNEQFSTDNSITTFVINLNDMSITRVAN